MKIYKILIFALFFLLMTGHAFAHKVIVFAWVEEGMIHIQASFGSKKKAKNCEITISDENKQIIHTGQTDMDGNYSLKLPSGIQSDLMVVLNAGSGHKGSWTILETEITADQTNGKEAQIDQTSVDPKMIQQDKVKEKIKELEKGPSIPKIFLGIGLIFGLAMVIMFLKKQKSIHD